MCGRYSLNATPRELAEHFDGVVPASAWSASGSITRYNVAPSQPALVIRRSNREGRNVPEPLVWGFRPQWAKRGWINARADTLFSAPAFKEAAQKRRCLVAATGWYEWRETGTPRKQPYYIHYGRPFAFAGVWTARRRTGADWELSFAIVTTAASGVLAQLHPRMPLVLSSDAYSAWLDPGTEDAAALLERVDVTAADAYPVTTLVNDPHNDSADCVAPAGSAIEGR